MSVELGSVREIWLAPSEDHAGNKNSFLVRDDSYVMSEASFGRSVRLGQPIDLGPTGAWRQDAWFGGYDQERWRDEFMYESGSADTTDRIGRIRLWPGYERLIGRGSRDNAKIGVLCSGAVGTGENTPLMAGEQRIDAGGGDPSGGYRLYSGKPQLANAPIDTTTSHVQAINLIGNEGGDSTGHLLIGYNNGNLHRLDQATGSVTADTGQIGSGAIGYNSICPYNGATYYCRGRQLIRRTWAPGEGVAHTLVKHFGTVDKFRGLVVWQNRLWMLGVSSGGQTTLFVSDGVTAVAAINFPIGFDGWCLTEHYGSLYVGGAVDATPGGQETSGQVWRYNGSSLIKLWDAREAESEGEAITSIASHDRFVVWGRHGNSTLGRRAGLWYYDAEEDAILEGPTLDMDPAADEYLVTAVTSWNSTIAVAFLDPRPTNYRHLLAFVRKDGGIAFKDNPAEGAPFGGVSFGYEPATIDRSVTASAYDADLQGEDKLYLSGYIRCQVPQGAGIRVGIIADGGSEVEVANITYNGDAGWRNVDFDIKDGTGAHIKATELQYVVHVENSDKATYPTANPEVDFIALQFIAAQERRRIWYARVVATDGQERLDGSANPLATRKAIVDKLVELWRSNGTLSFWEADVYASEPADGPEVTVTVSNLTEQSWRLNDQSGEVQSEVSFSLLEIGPTS